MRSLEREHSSEDLLRTPPDSVSPAILLSNRVDFCDKMLGPSTCTWHKEASKQAGRQASSSEPASSNPVHLRCYLPRYTSDPTGRVPSPAAASFSCQPQPQDVLPALLMASSKLACPHFRRGFTSSLKQLIGHDV